MIFKSKEILWRGRYLKCAEITYSDKKGNTHKWEVVERERTKGIVVVAPVTEQRRFIFVRQFRPPVGRMVIEFPAGLNDRDEPLEEVARRELLEETGYLAGKIIHLGMWPASSGISSEFLSGYLALDLKDTGVVNREAEEEDMEVFEVDVDDAFHRLRNMEKDGNYVDIKIYALIEMVREYLKNEIR